MQPVKLPLIEISFDNLSVSDKNNTDRSVLFLEII